MTEKSKRREAASQFAKMQREQVAKKASSDYEMTAADVRAKTERLRALRLARDAAAPAPAQRKRPKKAKPAALSEWLDGQSKEGRGS